MIKFIPLILTSLLSCLSSVRTEHICAIDFNCNGTLPNESDVEEYCDNLTGAKMIDRCCVLNDSIVGLDLRYCEIKILNLTNSNFQELVIMDMRDNELHKFTKKEFIGLINLEDLFLPAVIPCPGGNNAWNHTDIIHNMTECHGQLDPCVYLNISCTENGACAHTGPGSARCNCKPDHHGYKCLNEGTFPVTEFTLSLVIPTVVLCGALWFAVGRDPLKFL